MASRAIAPAYGSCCAVRVPRTSILPLPVRVFRPSLLQKSEEGLLASALNQVMEAMILDSAFLAAHGPFDDCDGRGWILRAVHFGQSVRVLSPHKAASNLLFTPHTHRPLGVGALLFARHCVAQH